MPPQQIGRYVAERELGRGGMATVYLARDPLMKRLVAVKVLPRQFTHDPQFRIRFEREAEIIAALEHPHIVPVYDFGVLQYGAEDDQPYLVMRYMTGGALADRLRSGRLSLEETARILAPLAGALDKAHARNIIHRDLKPGNILFDDDNEPYISDFGIAKIAEAGMTFTGSNLIGTPAYMSPEQARGERSIDGRSDVYAFGCLAYEVLTGQLPYEADTPMGLAFKHLTEPVPRILSARADLPPACEAVIARALAKDRNDRYATAGAFARDLHRAATGQPVEAMAKTSVEPAVILAPTIKELPLAGTAAHKPIEGDKQVKTPKPNAAALGDARLTEMPEAVKQSPASSNRWLVIGGMSVLVLVCAVVAVASGGMALSQLANRATKTNPPESTEAATMLSSTLVSEPTATAQPVAATEIVSTGPIQISWYIGLGTGSQAEQISRENDFVDKFNAAQSEIHLNTVIIDNQTARDYLLTQIAAGNAPDIIGPVGAEGRSYFPDAFLDLQPLIKQFNYDTSDFDPYFLERYTEQGELVALPFAIFPSALYYNRDLFDAAGLAYPPQRVGEKYNLDGQALEWNFDTLAEVAKRLTLDANGHDATRPNFNARNIIQYGFDFQWVRDNPRWFSAYFEPYYPLKDGKADLSFGQITAIHWYYDAQFGQQPFLPNQAAFDSLFQGDTNAFSSGKVAMALTHLWYTCCIDTARVNNWDVAVVPIYNGKLTAKIHTDTFYILKSTKNPEAAFKVYTYLIDTGAADLLGIYGIYGIGLPGRASQQAGYFKPLDDKFAPNKVNWQVFVDMIPYMEIPDHELGLPNSARANEAWFGFGSELRSDPNLDVDARIRQFLLDLTAIYQE